MSEDSSSKSTPPKARQRKTLRSALIGLAVLLVVVAAAAHLTVRYAERRPFPRIRGEVNVPGLEHPVEVVRDSRGIPHIYAQTPHDLFMAQGYVHAQDRFFQMDFWRHVGSGRLAELFGEDLVSTDTFIRTLGWGRVAQAQYDGAAAEDRAALEAYAEGVNAYIGSRAPGALGLEYSILGLSSPLEPPEPWEPAHTLSWAMAMAWDLRGNMDQEIARTVLEGTHLTREQVDQLYPPYPLDRHPTIVPDGGPAPTAEPAEPEAAPPMEALLRLRDRVADLDAITGGDGGHEGIGSNNWVLSGDRTSTGGALLANDPHLGIQMPSIWYQNGLHCEPVDDGCPYDVVGFSFASAPGVIIGHNARIAWGVTNLGPDVMDLYIERLHPGDPNRYEVEGQWRRMEVRTETIRVAGGEPVEIEVRTTRHGPVVSGAYGALDDFGERAGGVEVPERYAVALRWTALEPGPSVLSAFRGLDRAQNWEEFRDALRSYRVPSQNFVYADVDGNIGYQGPGAIPIRSKGDGRRPVPGWTSEHEWTGYIDFDDLPRQHNPPSGFIATANNRVMGEGYRHHLGEDWSYGYRARRIVDLLAARQTHTIESLQAIQLDSHSLFAAELLPHLEGLDLDGGAAELRDLFDDWDHRMEPDSAGAAAFAGFWRNLLALAFHDDLPERYRPYGGSRWYLVVTRMLERPDDPLWDDRGTDRVETRDDILVAALDAASAELREALGPSPRSWRWGRLHTADFVHQTLGKSGVGPIERRFNRTGFATAGSTSHVNATGWNAAESYVVDWLPSLRMVVDLADLSRSETVHTTGQSGHPGNRHYDDFIPLWAEGSYYPMLWRREEVEADAEATLVLRP